MNILFICSRNRLRSLTAEQIFKNMQGYTVRSAETSKQARIKIQRKDITWADLIFVMETKHQEMLKQRFPEETINKEIICLNIPDQYKYMDEELVDILKESLSSYLDFLQVE